jgi:phosphate transport system substrate-binding protein
MVLVATLLCFVATGVTGVATVAPASADAAPAKINGQGSSYVGLAMQQWVADGQVNGLQVNYTPSSSPAGLTSFQQSIADFAGTEAEYSALGMSDTVSRGYQYVPDVAGAVAIMYNVQDQAGNKVNYLHLSRATVAKIFMGQIRNWNDPAISADNPLPNSGGKLLQLGDHPITVVFRAGQSGTTALFYDFVQHMDPIGFAAWAGANGFPTQYRIVQLDSSPNFAPYTQGLNGSDQIAQHIGSNSGLWSIGYDEFGYAKTYNVTTAWIENAASQWVQPFAKNISAALESATLRPDLSQELSGVYASTNPDAYPISAYSYIVTQCAPSAQRASCKGPYANAGIAATLAPWMRYIACQGQVNMAQIGYSPLPPNLSQEMANSIGRMLGQPPETLNASNCANPRFKGNLGAGSQPAVVDPLHTGQGISNAAGGGSSGSGTNGKTSATHTGATTAGAGSATNANTATAADANASGADASTGATDNGADSGGDSGGAAAGRLGATQAAGGGSDNWKSPDPVSYDRPAVTSASILPLILLVILLAVPAFVVTRLADRRRPGQPRR